MFMRHMCPPGWSTSDAGPVGLTPASRVQINAPLPFDPDTLISGARAARLVVGVAEAPVKIGTAAGFLAEVLR